MSLRWRLAIVAAMCVLGSGCADPVQVADGGVSESSPSEAAPVPTAPATTSSAPAADASSSTPMAPVGFGGGATASPDAFGDSPSAPSNPASAPVAGSPPTDPFGAGGPTQTDADPFAGAAPPPGTVPDAAPPANTERTRAGVGVGAKGRSLDQYNSGVQQVIAQPAKSLFAARERLVFNVQIPQALQLYEATTGFAPRSHAEFMNEVIRANNIQLPELRPGHRYIYDPQRKELMVERPAQ